MHHLSGEGLWRSVFSGRPNTAAAIRLGLSSAVSRCFFSSASVTNTSLRRLIVMQEIVRPAAYGYNPDGNLSSCAPPVVAQRRSRWTRTLRREQIGLRRPHLKLRSQRSFNWTGGPPFHRSSVFPGLLRSPGSNRRLDFLAQSQSHRPCP